MRYDEFRDRWLRALRAEGVVSHQDRPEETIELTRMVRRWEAHLIPRPAEPFHAGATISFLWDPFASARSYAREEDLLTELFGRSRSGRSTQLRRVRVDIRLRASLVYGSTTPLPAADVWLPWVASVEEKLDDALCARRRRKADVIAWRGGLQLEGQTSPDGTFALHGMLVEAFEMIVVPRIWDDPKRREREASGAQQTHDLAKRFRAAVVAWTASVGELARWLQYAPSSPRTPPRRRRGGPDDRGGSETTH